MSSPQPIPMQVTLPGAALSISVGRLHACAVLADHTMWCWGMNQLGQLGDGTHDSTSHAPQRVSVCE